MIKVSKYHLAGALLATSLAIMPTTSLAFFPVIDYTAIAKMAEEYEQLKSQFDLLKNTYDNAKSQLSQAKQLTSDSEGHYGFGQMLNSDQDLQSREWSPDDWHSAISGLSGGNSDRYKQLQQQYQDDHPNNLSQDQFANGSSKEQAQTYNQAVQTNQAATVNSSYAFNDIKTHLDNIHQLSKQIDNAQNTKAAVDLDTRMQAEMAYVNVQELKQMAIMNEQLANRQSGDISEESQNAKFNTLPNQ